MDAFSLSLFSDYLACEENTSTEVNSKHKSGHCITELILSFFSTFLLLFSSGEVLHANLTPPTMAAASTSSETVRVIVRCRPMNQRENDLKSQVNVRSTIVAFNRSSDLSVSF